MVCPLLPELFHSHLCLWLYGLCSSSHLVPTSGWMGRLARQPAGWDQVGSLGLSTGPEECTGPGRDGLAVPGELEVGALGEVCLICRKLNITYSFTHFLFHS